MSFWTEASLEPKRSFRFKLLDGDQSTWWWAKSVDKPSFDISNSEYQLINHKFKYPGIVTWKPISLIVADVGDVINLLVDELRSIGYYDPSNELPMEGLAKDNKGFIEGLSIQQLNADGGAIETWTVKGAFMTSLSFSRLDYGSDDITEITIEVAYDYATFE
jgi:hypothetical protein|tara:strand:- start:411 stop:896 length:486 start_codon:yes stop_codon:yes gene_type:complete